MTTGGRGCLHSSQNYFFPVKFQSFIGLVFLGVTHRRADNALTWPVMAIGIENNSSKLNHALAGH